MTGVKNRKGAIPGTGTRANTKQAQTDTGYRAPGTQRRKGRSNFKMVLCLHRQATPQIKAHEEDRNGVFTAAEGL